MPLAFYHFLFDALAFVLGAVVGSFLNVCIYRLPRGLARELDVTRERVRQIQQEEIAPRLLHMLKGAMRELSTRWDERNSCFSIIAWPSLEIMKAANSLARLGWAEFFGTPN